MRKKVSRTTCGTPFCAISPARRAGEMALSNSRQPGGSPLHLALLPAAVIQTKSLWGLRPQPGFYSCTPSSSIGHQKSMGVWGFALTKDSAEQNITVSGVHVAQMAIAFRHVSIGSQIVINPAAALLQQMAETEIPQDQIAI